MHRPPLRLVGGEQAGAAPALQRGRKLPAQIDGVADAHVHAEAAERRMQVAGVAGQEHAAVGVAVGDQAVRDPGIGADDLDVQVAKPGAAADQVGRVDARRVDVVGQLGRHEEPQAVLVHRAEQRGHVGVHHPIHDGRAVQLPRREVGRAEDDAVVAQTPLSPAIRAPIASRTKLRAPSAPTR